MSDREAAKAAKRVYAARYYREHRAERIAAAAAYTREHREELNAAARRRAAGRPVWVRNRAARYYREHRAERVAAAKKYARSHRVEVNAYQVIFRKRQLALYPAKMAMQRHAHRQRYREAHSARLAARNRQYYYAHWEAENAYSRRYYREVTRVNRSTERAMAMFAAASFMTTRR